MPLEQPNTLPARDRSEDCGRAESLLTPPEVIAVANEEIPMQERRRDARYPTSDPAEVEIFPQAVVREGALILDVSRSGLRVHLKTEAPKGTRLKIRLLKTHLELGKHIHDMDLCFYVVGKRADRRGGYFTQRSPHDV
jgi:hypothetical protein